MQYIQFNEQVITSELQASFIGQAYNECDGVTHIRRIKSPLTWDRLSDMTARHNNNYTKQ